MPLTRKVQGYLFGQDQLMSHMLGHGRNIPKIPLLKLTSILSLNSRPVIFNASRLLKCSSPVVASSLGNDAVEDKESCMTTSYILSFVD